MSSAFGELNDLADELKDARDAAERVRLLVRDLKIFSRSEDEKLGSVDVRRVMESTLRMAWNEIRHRARVVKDYGRMPQVRANDSRLGQVFLNVLVNAAQAIPEGRAHINEIRVATGVGPDGRVVVTIADTGVGMAPEVVRRLFTPFFTTKPVGQGTGLGLSICRRLVTSFGGAIEVDSTVGVGTVVRIALPAADGMEAAPERPRSAPPAERRGHVLVVDDEAMVAKALRRALGAEHEVTTLSSAEEALKRIMAGERFDVILCDLMMPQMTGMELHAELMCVAPEEAARMIFVTGGAFTPGARDFLDHSANLRVEKPFDMQHLRTLVNEKIR
jgi:CheY-like chemotaxis protein